MARTLKYSTLDVFTNEALAGNQLGVVLLEDQDELSQTLKQSITREFNYSETIFIHPYNETTRSRQVDIFTPQSEIPFAGHPTIGAVHYIISNLSPEKDDEEGRCSIQLKAGMVKGSLDKKSGFASAEIPHDVHVHSKADLDWARVCDSQPELGKTTPEAGLASKKHAFVAITQGMNFSLIDLTEQPELLKKVKVSNKYVATAEDLDQGWAATVVASLFFVRKPDQGDSIIRIEQRVIVIGLEDPATGSASSALCAWLALQKGGAGSTYKFELEQGTQMGRKSIIGCEVTLAEDGAKVERVVLSGQCKRVMNGEMFI